MKRTLKISLIIILAVLLALFTVCLATLALPPKNKFNAKKLDNTCDFINFYDKHNNLISTKWTGKYMSEKPIPSYVKNAFIAIEDKNFYKHNGVDFKRMVKAFLVNVKSRSFAQGASTISQQLIKNTHLSNEKTISRKLDEIKLTLELEKKYSKEQIITMYLNTIYFGENAFGISSAAKKYFDKSPDELTIDEAALLAGIIQAPSKLNPVSNPEGCLKKRNLVLKRMLELEFISKEEYDENKSLPIKLAKNNEDEFSAYVNACFNELENISKLSPYTLKNCKVVTFYEQELQQALFNNQIEEYDFQGIIIDNESGGISAYVSNCREIEREIASTVKPILVYAPAIDKGLINELTVINDEEISFNGYSPKNFNDKYYGNVSAKFALSKSLNVPSVKILNSLGISTFNEYAKKLNVDVSNDGLSLALGNLGNGIKLKDLTAAYSTFANFGEYKKPCFINKIINENGKIIYQNDQRPKSIFKSSTATVINDMLLDCSKNGTAKKLSYLDFDICSKTGTNGTEHGNLDTYSMAYTTTHSFGIWNGTADNSLMPNDCTGSNAPTYVLGKICSEIYKNKKPNDFEHRDVVERLIDKLSYEDDGKILLADSNTPDNYLMKGIFPSDVPPLDFSDRFSSCPQISATIALKDNTVIIEYHLPAYAEIEVYKAFNGEKILNYCGIEPYTELLTDPGEYAYSLVVKINGKKQFVCDEIQLKQIIFDKKIDGTNNSVEPPDNWWNIE